MHEDHQRADLPGTSARGAGAPDHLGGRERHGRGRHDSALQVDQDERGRARIEHLEKAPADALPRQESVSLD